VRAGRPVVLPALPKGLPADAKSESDYVKASGLRSHLSIPLRMRGRTSGVLSFAGFRRARDWPQDLIVRLTIIGEVFASAAARARSEEEAHQLRTRLWHADRVARISALTATIAHEINQPLTAIVNNATASIGLLADRQTNLDDVRAALRDVVNDAERASAVVERVRQMSRRLPPSRRPCRIQAIVDDVVALAARTAAGRGVAISVEIPRELPPVLGDLVQLEQVLLNLVVNAMDAMSETDPSQRRVEIRAAAGMEAGQPSVTIRVADRGVGLRAEDMPRLFEAFHTTKPNGMGLGLAVSRSIVEAHGGRLWAEPNQEQGAVFAVRLAAAQAGAAA
jgi:signal transduction histidine kinase